MLRLLICFLFIFLFAQNDWASEKVIADLEHKISNSPNDSIKVHLLFELDDRIYISNPERDILLNQEIIRICSSKIKRDFYSKYYNHSLSRALNNLGLAYTEKNRLHEALELLNQSYRIANKYHYNELKGHTSNNIGTIYRSLKEYKKAIQYYSKSLAITKDSSLTPETFNNIGLCYMDLKMLRKAEYYFLISLRFSESAYHVLNKANTLLNLGDLMYEQRLYKKATQFYEQALEVNSKLENAHGIAYSYWKLADLYRNEKNYERAEEFAIKAFTFSQQEKLLYNQERASFILYKIYRERKQLDLALNYYEKYNLLNDSFTKLTNKEELIKEQYSFEFKNREELEKAKHKKELELVGEQNKRQALMLIFSIILTFVILIVLIFGIRSFRKIKVFSSLIELQKDEVELKNREITDSITYAKRIQHAILPSTESILTAFPSHYIFYKPKDIVAGDFFWFVELEDSFLFAVADCTGHGVPGAMVSVVCNNALNRSVKEYQLHQPAQILNKTRDLIIREFNQTDASVNDGMDISLVKFYKDNYKIEWAGANNPLCIGRASEIQVLKADKQPIGRFGSGSPFTNHSFLTQKGDRLYLCTDGFADQFGGPAKKKFKSKNLWLLFRDFATLDIQESHKKLQETFLVWKGSEEQVDDVCIACIEVV